MSGPPPGTHLLPDAAPAEEPATGDRLADPERLAAVQRLAQNAPGSPALQRLTDLAVRMLEAPIAQISLIGSAETAAVVSGRPQTDTGAQVALAESFCAVALTRSTDPLVISDAAVDPRVAGRAAAATGAVGSYLGVPLTSADGQRVGVLCVYGDRPREWSERDAAVLTMLADSVTAELELTALTREYEDDRLRFQLAIDAAGIGTFDDDLVTGRLGWDDRTQRLFGYEPGTFPGEAAAFHARVHPEDRERVAQAVRQAIAACSSIEQEYRLLLPGGHVRWVQTRGRVVAGPGGQPARLVGAVSDTTRQRHADAQVARVLETMPAAFYSLTPDWRFAYVNAQAERLLRRPRSELLGRLITDVFPPELTTTFRREYLAAVESGRPVTFEASYPTPQRRWFEVRAWPGPDGLAVYLLDVTERHCAEVLARRRAERLRLVGEVSAALSSALVERSGARAALDQLTRAMVPAMGDWVIASLVEDDGRLHDVASCHRDAVLGPAVARYAELRLAAVPPTAPLLAALAGQQLLQPDVQREVAPSLPPGEVSELFEQLAPAACVAVPLVARGRALGAMSLYRGAGRDAFDADDLRTVQEVADRVALALDSAALHEHERRMAAELQRSLLTEPPQPEHCRIAVRYVPAVRAAQVGGDWYDAFVPPDGATVLVIGDVVGHDTVAAAAMGQLRSLLRAIGFSSGGGPAAVLADLDRTMAGLQVHTLASAAVARLARDGDLAAGETRLCWSSAGHPPLLVRHPDGRVEELGAEVCDLILGVDPDTSRTEHVTVLRGGATVLLYTDGLVESRELPVDEGVDRLRGLLAELGGLPLEELCDALVARMRPGGYEDDVALVAVRLHPPAAAAG